MCTESDHALLGFDGFKFFNQWHPWLELLQPIQVYSVKLSTLLLVENFTV